MEGPSLVILSEELDQFRGKRVLEVSGNTRQPKEELEGLVLKEIHTWGKVLFLIFSGSISLRIHFLLFGSYRINEPKPNGKPRLQLNFKNGTIYFYGCSVQWDGLEEWVSLDKEVDVLSPDWSEEHVVELLRKKKNSYLCDLFLDQHLFAGSGNIVKNEVLFNIRLHPLTKLSQIPEDEWFQIAHAVKDYCFNFYEWKKAYQLRKHWQVYKQYYCPVCESKLKREKLGATQRTTFYCEFCQAYSSRKQHLYIHDVLPMKGSVEIEKRLDH